MKIKQRTQVTAQYPTYNTVSTALSLFLETQRVFAAIEANGIKVDKDLLIKQIKKCENLINEIYSRLTLSDIGKRWLAIYPKNCGNSKKQFALHNRNQLADVLFHNPKGFRYSVLDITEQGKPDISETALQRLPIDRQFVQDYSDYQSYVKLKSTYLEGLIPLIDPEGFIHPSFGLMSVISYRTTCVAKGSLIMVDRDYDKHPMGVPIEEVREGDYAFCFDDELKPRLRKVLWAGKTGHKKVVRIHFERKGGRRGFLDVTPDHRIRMTDGGYVAAKDLIPNSWGLALYRANKKKSALHPNQVSLREHEFATEETLEADVINPQISFISIEEIPYAVDVYDLQVEDCHNFIANELCVHNSSNPNFQNYPNHNPKLSSLIRSVFIPRSPEHHIVEVDYSGAEVRAVASINGDPTLIKSITEGLDFHKWVASQCYMIPEADITKSLRQSVKGAFTFAAFYGSYWKQIAVGVWDEICYSNLKTKDGTPLIEYLRTKGITELGDKDNPAPGSYFLHIKKIENRFWKELFPVYAQWKNSIWDEFQKTGVLEIPSGFRTAAVLTKNHTSNIGSQGSAAHCLLTALCFIYRDMKNDPRFSRSFIVGQIHDSIVADIHHDELDDYLRLARKRMVETVPKIHKWLTVPLEVDADVSPAGKSWLEKKGYKIPE